jgi:hypothetical protein
VGYFHGISGMSVGVKNTRFIVNCKHVKQFLRIAFRRCANVARKQIMMELNIKPIKPLRLLYFPHLCMGRLYYPGYFSPVNALSTSIRMHAFNNDAVLV